MAIETSVAIQKRARDPLKQWQKEAAAISLVTALFYGSDRPRPSTIEVWNGKIRASVFNSLSYDNIRDYMNARGTTIFDRLGSTQAPRYIVCDMVALNATIGRPSDSDCTCTLQGCCTEGDEACISASQGVPALEKRTGPKDYKFTVHDQGRQIEVNWQLPSVSN